MKALQFRDYSMQYPQFLEAVEGIMKPHDGTSNWRQAA